MNSIENEMDYRFLEITAQKMNEFLKRALVCILELSEGCETEIFDCPVCGAQL